MSVQTVSIQPYTDQKPGTYVCPFVRAFMLPLLLHY